MKKVGFVSAVSALFLLVSSVCAYCLRYVPFSNAWWPLLFGGILLAVSGGMAVPARRFAWLNLVCFGISGVALGFCIRSWYIFRGFDNPLLMMCLVALVSALSLWVYWLYSFLPLFDRHPNGMTFLFFGVSLTLYILLVIFTKTTFLSTFGFYMIVETAFLFALCTQASTYRTLFRHAVLSTYSVALVAVLIALIMLDGDGLDVGMDAGLDFDFSSFKKNNAKPLGKG